MPKPEKVAAVQEITGRLSASDAVLLTEYRGLSVGEMAEVRGVLRENDADFKVLKNTLARIAVREVGLSELVELLEGPTAIAFCRGDAAAAAKALDEATRRFPVLVVKGGVLAGRVIGAEQAQELGRLEPREVLLTKTATMMNAPAQRAASVLGALLNDLASMLGRVLAAKEGEPTGPAERATPPEASDGSDGEAAPGGEEQEG